MPVYLGDIEQCGSHRLQGTGRRGIVFGYALNNRTLVLLTAAKSYRSCRLVGESLIFRSREAVDLRQAVVPVLINAGLSAHPHYIEFSFCHKNVTIS